MQSVVLSVERPQACSFSSVISEIDISRAANLGCSSAGATKRSRKASRAPTILHSKRRSLWRSGLAPDRGCRRAATSPAPIITSARRTRGCTVRSSSSGLPPLSPVASGHIGGIKRMPTKNGPGDRPRRAISWSQVRFALNFPSAGHVPEGFKNATSPFRSPPAAARIASRSRRRPGRAASSPSSDAVPV